MVLIDVDMVVTRPLTELIESAASGRVVAVRENVDRHVPSGARSSGWAPLGGAPTSPRGSSPSAARSAPRCSASGTTGCRRWITSARGSPRTSPSTRSSSWTRTSSTRSSIPCPTPASWRSTSGWRHTSRTAGCEMRDATTLRCSYEDGVEPYVLHQYLGKPWIDPMYHGIYSRALSRLLARARRRGANARGGGASADAARAPSARGPQGRRRRRPRALARARRDPRVDRLEAEAAGRGSADVNRAAFYFASSDLYFLGAVAMLNSLRLQEPPRTALRPRRRAHRGPARSARRRGDGRPRARRRRRAALAPEDGGTPRPPR